MHRGPYARFARAPSREEEAMSETLASASAAATAAVQPGAKPERVKIPAMELPEARRKLKINQPLYPKGAIKILNGKHVVRITAFQDKYTEYRVFWPGQNEDFFTSDWGKAVSVALFQAGELTKAPVVAASVAVNGESLAFEYHKVCAQHAGLTNTRLLQLSAQVASSAKEKTEEVMNAIATTPLSPTSNAADLLQSGKLLQDIIDKHPHLTRTQILADIEDLLPTADKVLSDHEIMEQFKKAKELHIKGTTMKSYVQETERLTDHVNKPLRLIRREDVDRCAEELFVKRPPAVTEMKVNHSGRDKFLTRNSTVFSFMINRGYYPVGLRNPVQNQLIGRSLQVVNPDCIMSPAEFHKWVELVSWYCVPFTVAAGDGGIRPEAIPFMMWDMLDWKRKIWRVPAWASKTYKAVYPRLSDSAYEILLPWRNCIGPICPFQYIPEEARETAVNAGIRDVFQDDARKSSISHRAGQLRVEVNGVVVSGFETMNSEYGNSVLIRRLFYHDYREKEEGDEYFTYARMIAAMQLSEKETGQFLRSIRTAQTKIQMRIKEFNKKVTMESSAAERAQVEVIARSEALEILSKGQLLPSFASFAPNFPTNIFIRPARQKQLLGDLFDYMETGGQD
jgi:hypothetical protein